MFVTQWSAVSFPPVISIDGNLACKSYKTETNSKQTCTVEGILGAFLVTKDSLVSKESLDKGGGGKTKRKGKEKVSNEYAMLALDRHEEVPCVSCGYPTLRAFAPEKHLRFERSYTCSTGCFYHRAHCKEAGTDVLEKIQ